MFSTACHCLQLTATDILINTNFNAEQCDMFYHVYVYTAS